MSKQAPLVVYLRGKEKRVRIMQPGTLRLKKTTRDGHLAIELNGVEIGGFAPADPDDAQPANRDEGLTPAK